MYWNWKIGGAALGLCFFVTVLFMKPIGVSTQFVILDGIFMKQVNPEVVYKDETSKTGFASTNAYLNKSGGKYAKEVANPLNYSFLFVVSMLIGGMLGKLIQPSSSKEETAQIPEFHTSRFGTTPAKRYLLSFIGGIIVLFGARLAGGCTSGHMMSGMMQTAVSGYLFAFAAFIVAVPTAIYLYKK